MDATELVQEYFRRTDKYRSDLNALADFVEEWRSGSIGNDVKQVKLFWHTFRPSAINAEAICPIADSDGELPPLAGDLEAGFLEELAGLERVCRIPYVPDSDDMPDFSSAGQYIYVGAASALRHRRRDGFSEYVRHTLKEVWRFLKIVEKTGHIDFGLPLLQEKLPPWETVSLYGMAGLV